MSQCHGGNDSRNFEGSFFTPNINAPRLLETSASIIPIIKRNTPDVLIFLTFSTKFKWISNLLKSYSLSVPEIKCLSFIPQISHYYILPPFLTSSLQSLVFVSVSHHSSKDSMCWYRPTKINCSYRIPVKSVTESTVQSRREIPLFGTLVRWSKT